MHCKIRLILLTLTSNVHTQHPGVCESDSQGIPLSCCRNYQLFENNCIECPGGFYGENCTDECPSQHYGRFCVQICSCVKCQCDKAKGCVNTTEKCDTENGTESFQFHWPSISISISGTVVVCFTFCIVMICILRKRRPVTRGCVVSTTHEKDMTASQNVYDYLGKESYNVLKLTTSSNGIL